MTRTPLLVVEPLYGPVMEELAEHFEVHVLADAADRETLLATLAPDCRLLLTNSAKGADASLMQALPGLRMVACSGVGTDRLDLDYCRAHDIRASNTPDVLTEDVADMALALLLATVREIVVGDHFVREGRWPRGSIGLTTSLQGRCVGILGLGRIGHAIARRCVAFNTTIGYHGRRQQAEVAHRYFDSAIDLAGWADVLIAALPGGADSERLVSREVLEALGPAGVFINIARGSVVDEEALVELLGTGRLAGAGLDVFAHEPEVPAALFALPGVVLQPHRASGTTRTRLAMGQLALRNLLAFEAGDPLPTPVA